MADADLQRIIDDLRKRREMLEIAISESVHKSAEVARTILDVDRLRERFARNSGEDLLPPPVQSEPEKRE
jgi:hypothetical protein